MARARVTHLRDEVSAFTYPLRRKVRNRLSAAGNDALTLLRRSPRFEENSAEQWRRILARSGRVLESMPPPVGPKVLFGTLFGESWMSRSVESTFAMALRLRGAASTILACDASLPACEWNPLGNHDPDPGYFGDGAGHFAKQRYCNTCSLKLDECYSLPGLARCSLRKYAEPGDTERAHRLAQSATLSGLRDFVHEGINVGEHAYAALLRATLRGTPLDDEKTRWLAKRYLASCIQLVEVGERVLADLRPDRFVTTDGVYVLAGTFSELARKRGVHVVVHGPPYRKGTVWLSHDDCYHRLLVSKPDDGWRALEMTPERQKVAEEYLASKHFVARDYVSYHVDSMRDPDEIRRELGLDSRPIVSLFTNVLWDAQLYYRFKVFPDMLAWLFATIRFYATRPDLQLVVRLHPGEARGLMPTNQPLYPELMRALPELPENVKIVKPESRVSSYALGQMSGVALIYGARVGVELVMLGTPVVVAGEAFMRNKGFSYDPVSVEEYFALLGRGVELPRPCPATRALATKWYYHYFFRLMLPYPYYEETVVNGRGHNRFTFESLEALLPGHSPVLDRICQGIVDGTTPFEWDQFEARV